MAFPWKASQTLSFSRSESLFLLMDVFGMVVSARELLRPTACSGVESFP